MLPRRSVAVTFGPAHGLRLSNFNTAINRMAGSPRPDYRPLTARYGERFQMQDTDNLEPVPSGLLGTIRLLSAMRN